MVMMITMKCMFNVFQQVSPISKYNLIFPCSLSKHCAFHTSAVKLLFFESDPKAGYRKFRPNPSTKDIIRHSLKQVKEEIQLWKNEMTEIWDADFINQGMPGVVFKPFEFKNDTDLKKWIVTSDKDNEEGESTCQLTINENGNGLFSGNICLDVPKDGIMKRSGYCNIRTVRTKRSFQRDSHFNWGMYTHLVFRVRGDGRSYGINLSTSNYFDQTWNDMYTYALFTRGGPYWQYSRKGRVQDLQFPIPLWQIAHFGITLAERAPGPFSLEIDYIGLEFDPSHTEKFAYELYKLPWGIAST